MNFKKLRTIFLLLLAAIFLMASCTSAGGSEPAVENMEEMEDHNAGAEHEENGEHDHEDDHDSHEHEHADNVTRIMNDGAAIEIISPTTGETFGFGEPVLVEVDVKDFELGVDGSHWHVYIDGSSWGMVLGGNLDQPLVGLEPGQHMVEVYLANGDHEELMDGDSIMIVVEDQ